MYVHVKYLLQHFHALGRHQSHGGRGDLDNLIVGDVSGKEGLLLSDEAGDFHFFYLFAADGKDTVTKQKGTINYCLLFDCSNNN